MGEDACKTRKQRGKGRSRSSIGYSLQPGNTQIGVMSATTPSSHLPHACEEEEEERKTTTI
jgi:hypothetical protein